LRIRCPHCGFLFDVPAHERGTVPCPHCGQPVACAPTPLVDSKANDPATGAVAGAVIGGLLVGTAIGALIGGLVGLLIGKQRQRQGDG
jgi:predicted lipid-binding transport protein (Tim44 family)